ncbi:MAG: hypothetical protein NZ908_02915, partial [Candidatus Micrarchaeota archaeon]|nr:hypothetical protein [Candidatus Micrarchaeota archaeon]
RSEPITGEGTDESEMKKPPEQQPQTPRESERQSTPKTTDVQPGQQTPRNIQPDELAYQKYKEGERQSTPKTTDVQPGQQTQPKGYIPDQGVLEEKEIQISPRKTEQPSKDTPKPRVIRNVPNYEPVPIPNVGIPEQTRQTITEYKVSLETPRTVFLNSNPNISERDNKFEIRIQFNQSLIEDMEGIVIRIGNSSMKISRDRMTINENGELVLGISTGFLGFNLGTQTVMVAVYGKEGRELTRTTGTTIFLLDGINITSPKSMYTNRIPVVASYNIIPGAAREIESHELGVVGTAQGKDGKWYLFFAENTSVNREPVSGYRVFDTKEELEKFLRENEIITQTQNIKRGGITFNLNFEIPTGLEIDRTEFRMLGQVRVDGITREVNVGSITDLRYLPRSEPITGEGTDESEMKKPPEQQPQTLEPPKEQQIQREIQIAIDAPTSVVEGSEEPIPVQVKIENATTASIFLVDKQDNIVLPDGRVIGKLEDFIDEITGLLDLDKLSAELSKHPQARVSADGQLLLNNRGEGFTVHVLAINDDEKKLMRQEIGTVEISANIDVQNGSIRNGIVEKPVEVTLKLEPPGVTGSDPLKQVTIDGKSLEELQRQGLVEVDYDSKTQEVKITLTDRGMIELGGDGKVEVRLYGRYGVEGAHGTTELRLQKDASVEVRRTETEIVAPSVYTIEHENGVLKTPGRFINVKIITNELEDVNRDSVVNEKDVIELLKSGKIGFSLKIDDNKVVPLDFKLAGDNAIRVQKQGDRYVIDFIIQEASIMRVLMYHGAHTRKAVELISKYDDKSETTLVGLVNVTLGEFPKLNNVSIEIAKSVENPGSQQQPGVRDTEVLQYSEGNLESALNTISGEIFSFRFQGKRYQEIRQVVENIFRGLSIRNTNEEDSAIAVLFGRLNNNQTDSLSLSELIEIARKDINSLNEREVLKLALFAVALDLELLERNQNELNPSSSIDDLKENKYLEAAHKLLVALFGENLSDEQRKQRIEEARNVYLINNNNYNSLFKALIGEWGVTEREVVVFKTPLLTFHMDKVLWESLTPEQRMQLILSMNATVSLLRGEVRGENQRKDLLGGEIDTKIGLKVLYENGRVKIAAEGGLVGRLPIPIQDWNGVLANRAELGAYARMYGNIAMIQDKNGSLEFVFGAEAGLDKILSRDQPARFYMVSNVGVVTRLERVEENGKAYYRYEALAEGNIGVSEGEVRVDGGRIVVRGNIDENRFVGISVGLGGGRGNMLRTIGVMFGMNLEDDNNKQFNINLSYNPEQGRFNFNLGLNVRF